MRPMNREVPKDEDSEEKTIHNANGCTPLAAAPLEWDDETTTIDLWLECEARGLSLRALDPR